VFRARRVGHDDPRPLVERCWDLEAISADYKRFIAKYEPLARIRRTLLPNPAFVLRFAVVLDFLEVAWRDPELIPRLLPPHWPGTKARRLARSLFERLLPAATGFGDSLRSDM